MRGLARVPAGIDLAQFPIRAIIMPEAEDKLASELQRGSFPQCLIEAGGIRVRALFFPKVSQESSRLLIEKVGFEILDNHKGVFRYHGEAGGTVCTGRLANDHGRSSTGM